jgi:hypothetical protein
MSKSGPQFDDAPADDPQLRAALKHALGAQTAPAELRQRIAKALDSESGSATAVPGRKAFRLTVSRAILYGIAAVLLVAVGVKMWPSAEEPAPDWFAAAMATTHDRCAALPDHHLIPEVKDDNLSDLRKVLSEKLGHSVLIAMLDDGWKFGGAGICNIGRFPASHLIFTRGEDTISIFSVTSTAFYRGYNSEGKAYSQTESGHQIAGFVYKGAIHCVVESSKSGNVTLKQAIKLRDKLRAQVESGMAVAGVCEVP